MEMERLGYEYLFEQGTVDEFWFKVLGYRVVFVRMVPVLMILVAYATIIGSRWSLLISLYCVYEIYLSVYYLLAAMQESGEGWEQEMAHRMQVIAMSRIHLP